jgi:hypothetical protein
LHCNMSVNDPKWTLTLDVGFKDKADISKPRAIYGQWLA